MTTALDPAAGSVLSLWFGPTSPDGRVDDEHRRRWFAKDDAFDALLRGQFLALHAAVVARQHEGWLETPSGRLAYVIVLDQFSRNMFRGTPGMFASDPQALHVAVQGIDRGEDRGLPEDWRTFLYMPLMHSERLADQERCVALFMAARDAAPGVARASWENAVKFAEMHRDVVARFGRFPHRNVILGRASTPGEETFLKEPGSSF